MAAQFRVGTGSVVQIYAQHCAICHGSNLEGGLGGSLLNPEWRYLEGDESQALARIIRDGREDFGMEPFAGTLSEEEIRSLVIYLQERRQEALRVAPEETGQAEVFRAGEVTLRVEEVIRTEGLPWSVEFLPDGRMLFTEIEGALRVLDPATGRTTRIRGTPEVWVRGQGGLLDIGLPTDYKQSSWIYLAFAQPAGRTSGRPAGMTAVVRGRIDGDRWVDQEDIWRPQAEWHRTSGVHFGVRLAFQGDHLFFGFGDRGRPDLAQDLGHPAGAVHRVHLDGRIPADNPFVDRAGALPTIWSYGHRNPQGLVFRPGTGELWSSEHGPRGGDEINHIRRGLNYGWPLVTHGMNYDGTPITAETSRPGLEPPAHVWTPSIAVCAIDFHTGEVFPEWEGDLFAGGLVTEQLHRLRIRDGKVVEDEIVLRGLGRIRDVRQGPDGHLYLALNGDRGSAGTHRIVRLVRADERPEPRRR